MKTRRKKINRSPRTIYSRNVAARVVEQGARVTVNGVRADGPAQKNVKARPVFVGRQYTGLNTGKVYPYAGTKRGGLTKPI